MLSEKQWKADAVVRLMLGVIVCIFAGSLVVSGNHYLRNGGQWVSWFFLLATLAMGLLMLSLILVHGRWRLDFFLTRLIVVLVCFYAGVILAAWAQKLAGRPAQSSGQLIVATVSFQGATLALAWRFVRDHALTWRDAFGFSNRWIHALLFGIIAACVFLPIGDRLQRLSYRAIESMPQPGKPQEQEAVKTLRGTSSPVDRVALGSVTILLAPLGEEVLFRGIIYPWIKQLGFRKLALWLTSILFAAVHLNLLTFLPLFVLAVILTLLYEHTDNLVAPITCHALFNAMNFVMLYLSESG